MTTTWPDVRDLIAGCRPVQLSRLLLTLTGEERAEIAAHLPAFLKEMRSAATRIARAFWNDIPASELDLPGWAAGRLDHAEFAGDVHETYAACLRLAGAATLPAAAAAKWLAHRDLNPRWESDRHDSRLLQVLASRPTAWQGEVGVRLAERIRRPGDTIVPLVLELLRSSGAEPPKHDPLVVAWVSGPVLKDDPLAPWLLPRVFEAEGAGRALRDEQVPSASVPRATPWLRAVAAMPREQLLDALLTRFFSGGDQLDLRFFVRLHTMAAPTPEERTARLRDYVRLLPASPGTVAELALDQVRHLEFDDEADLVEAIEALTFRPEIKLATAGLRWFADLMKERPALAPDLAPALANAFSHTAWAVQHRAEQLALKHAAALRPAAAILAQAVPHLPPASGAKVAACFGGEVTPEGPCGPEVFVPGTLPEVAAESRSRLPEPTLSSGVRHVNGLTAEQWMAAFVGRLADREALRAELAATEQLAEPYLFSLDAWPSASMWLTALATEVVAPGTDPGVPDPEPVDRWADTSFQVKVVVTEPDEAESAETQPGPWFTEMPPDAREEIFRQLDGIGVEAERIAAMRDGGPVPPPGSDEPFWTVSVMSFGFSSFFRDEEAERVELERRRSRMPYHSSVAPLQLFMLRRLHELYQALREGTVPPVLLATPTWSTGHLDPDVLVDRLATCAAAGAHPLKADFQQALLRLPRGAHPEAAARAAAIGSRAAGQAADWLARGGLPDPETGVAWKPDGIDPVPALSAEPTGYDLIDQLLSAPARWRAEDTYDGMRWWAQAMPSHREVVAVHYLPYLVDRWNHSNVGADSLEALIQADGPVGEAMAALVAGLLTRPHGPGAHLILHLAVRGHPDAGAVGRHLGGLIRHSEVEIRRVLPLLDQAAREGAHAQVWEMLRALLPVVLPAGEERANVNHSDLVAFAARVAGWVGARGEIPEVAVHAAGKGQSRFRRECRALNAVIVGG
ncbi:DUF6493 family protein [Nonomuraea soli]|uniref:DUF7824 domain-containing protein n=1 Tax=Nonomuraea soli TaxID=1032476 RepID=A0A7W0CKK3_9ACTN|nr:DUF6493 family protein [Nonomuraea soli]MBA2892845.1 hypothetical protein [Nonomuraea soli]